MLGVVQHESQVSSGEGEGGGGGGYSPSQFSFIEKGV